MGFDLSQYATVEERLKLFWEAHPEGRIHTEIAAGDIENWVVFKAAVYRHHDDHHPVATGYAYEIRTDRGVNATSHIENSETSSVGRCLSNWIYSASKRPSREEMAKVERMGGTPAQSSNPDEVTPGQVRMLRALNYQGDPKALSKREAMRVIDDLKRDAMGEENF